MEIIPVINRITEIDGVIAYSLQNPSRKFPFLNHDSLNFWRLGALVLAFVATFSRIKIFIIRFHKHIFPVYETLINNNKNNEVLFSENDDDFDESDDDDDLASSCSFDESDDEGEYDGELFEYEDYNVAGSGRCNGFNEDERKNGKFELRHRENGAGERFSWSEFTSGKSVVKLWDGFGVGWDLNGENGKSLISIYDLCKDEKLATFSGAGDNFTIPAFTCASPGVIFSAGVESSRNLALKLWDSRVGYQFPAIFTDLKTSGEKVVGVNAGGVNKVYVRDGINGEVTVRDMRKVDVPLKNATESSNGNTRWDADAVTVSHECEDDITAGSFCHDAVLPYWI